MTTGLLPRLVTVTAVVLASLGGAVAGPVSAAATPGPGHDDHRPPAWRVRDASLSADPAAVVRRGGPHARAGALLRVVSLVEERGRPRVRVQVVRGASAAQAAVVAVQNDPDALAVALDSRVRAAGGAAPAAAGEPVANDRYRAQQWALSDLEAEATWQHSRGQGMVVAVVDSGVRAAHEDLEGQVLPGRDYLTPSSQGWADPNGHGTHVAGVVAATAGNSLGVAGLAPQAAVLPVRVLDETGTGWNSDVAAGIIWAVDHGADVVNLSLAGTQSNATLASAVRYAVAEGAVVVAAAGNERRNGNEPTYPAGYPDVLGVAATDVARGSAVFSNTGGYVDLAAPGVEILSTVPAGYASFSGTSMATPYVAAAAALVGAANPTADAQQISTALLGTVLDLGATGRDDEFGHGLVRPRLAAEAVAGSDPPGPFERRFDTMATAQYVRVGADVRLQARLVDAVTGAPVVDVPVRLEGRRSGRLVVRVTRRTDASGEVEAVVTLARTTSFAAVAPASEAWTATRAALGVWRARPDVSVTPRRRAVTVVVAPADGQRVKLQRWSGSTWRTKRLLGLDASGSARARALVVGRWRAVATPGRDLARATSRSWRVR